MIAEERAQRRVGGAGGGERLRRAVEAQHLGERDHARAQAGLGGRGLQVGEADRPARRDPGAVERIGSAGRIAELADVEHPAGREQRGRFAHELDGAVVDHPRALVFARRRRRRARRGPGRRCVLFLRRALLFVGVALGRARSGRARPGRGLGVRLLLFGRVGIDAGAEVADHLVGDDQLEALRTRGQAQGVGERHRQALLLLRAGERWREIDVDCLEPGRGLRHRRQRVAQRASDEAEPAAHLEQVHRPVPVLAQGAAQEETRRQRGSEGLALQRRVRLAEEVRERGLGLVELRLRVADPLVVGAQIVGRDPRRGPARRIGAHVGQLGIGHGRLGRRVEHHPALGDLLGQDLQRRHVGARQPHQGLERRRSCVGEDLTQRVLAVAAIEEHRGLIVEAVRLAGSIVDGDLQRLARGRAAQVDGAAGDARIARQERRDLVDLLSARRGQHQHPPRPQHRHELLDLRSGRARRAGRARPRPPRRRAGSRAGARARRGSSRRRRRSGRARRRRRRRGRGTRGSGRARAGPSDASGARLGVERRQARAKAITAPAEGERP